MATAIVKASHAGQPQDRAQAPERAFVELERAAVDRGQFNDDRQAKAGAGPRLVKPLSPLDRRGARALVEARPVVVNLRDKKWIGIPFGSACGMNRDPFARPLSRIVEEVADQIASDPALRPGISGPAAMRRRRSKPGRHAASRRCGPALDDRLHFRRNAKGPGAGGGACAVEIERHLPAHDLGLFAHLFRQGGAHRIRFVHQNAERRFERMGEIADLRARSTISRFASIS